MRAVEYGCINLNNAFVVRNKRHRLFKKRALRLSLPEMIWIALASLFYIGLFSLVILILSLVPIIKDLVSFLLVVPAPIFGWYTGRRIARASPYRSHSGEGLSEFLWVQSDRLGPILGMVFGRKIATSEVTTVVSGKSLTVECVEWLGTTRAQMMPKFFSSRGNSAMDVILVPSTVPTDWVRRLQIKQNSIGRQSFVD